MPIEQATELEVPVTIQGSKSVDGQGRRELFTETTKTTIVFATGAVLSLKAKVQPGQCVFLKNEQSGREMLCKVMESRSGGEVFYTDLEFTARDPEFWDAKAAPEPSTPTPGPQKSAEEFASPQVTAAVPEANKPFTGNIPVTSTTSAASVLAATPPVPLAPLELVPAHEQAAALPVTQPVTAPETPPDWDEAREQELVAALIAMEGGKAPKRESAKKDTKGSAATASDGAPQQGDASSDAASSEEGNEAAELKAQPLRKWRPRSFTANAKNPMAIGIAASLILVAVLGVAWRAKRGASARSNRQSAFNSAPTPAANAPVAGQAGQQPTTQVSTAAPANAPATGTQPTASVPPGSKPAENTAATSASSDKANPGAANSDQTALAQRQSKSRKKNAMKGADVTPAKVVSQPPPAMPPWAKGLDTDGIVTLDALIDEKGNVAEAKPISGPRMLQGAAERAVALWVFEPALADGKPIATHMMLTVEFQR